MAIHQEVLDAARRICGERGGFTFTPNEIVRALPHLASNSIRTHVTSRCCANAPPNHPHRWDYFRRVRRGVYEIRARWRGGSGRLKPAPTRADAREPASAGGRSADRVAEARAVYGATPARDTIHAFVGRDADWYLAECAEIAVVTQGRTLDELVANLRDAVGLHLDGGDAERLGLAAEPRLVLTYETRLER